MELLRERLGLQPGTPAQELKQHYEREKTTLSSTIKNTRNPVVLAQQRRKLDDLEDAFANAFDVKKKVQQQQVHKEEQKKGLIQEFFQVYVLPKKKNIKPESYFKNDKLAQENQKKEEEKLKKQPILITEPTPKKPSNIKELDEKALKQQQKDLLKVMEFLRDMGIAATLMKPGIIESGPHVGQPCLLVRGTQRELEHVRLALQESGYALKKEEGLFTIKKVIPEWKQDAKPNTPQQQEEKHHTPTAPTPFSTKPRPPGTV